MQNRNKSEITKKRKAWSSEEDKIITQLIKEEGINHWKRIA